MQSLDAIRRQAAVPSSSSGSSGQTCMRRAPLCGGTSSTSTSSSAGFSARGGQTVAAAARGGGRGAPPSSSGSSNRAQLVQDDAETLRNMVASQMQYKVRRGPGPASSKQVAARKNPVSEFVHKLSVAWRIFFPEQPQSLSPKEEVKKRLKMVLVADRCGMSPASLAEMKKTIVKALQDYVDIEGEEGVEVAITNEPGLGTVYSVNIPIKRVRAETRFADEMEGVEGGHDGVTLEWDPTDRDSDPSGRFPFGC